MSIFRYLVFLFAVFQGFTATAEKASIFDYTLKADVRFEVKENYPELWDPAEGALNNPSNTVILTQPMVVIENREYPIRMESVANLCKAFGKVPGEINFSMRQTLRNLCEDSPECQKSSVNARILEDGSVDLDPRAGSDDIGILFCE